MMATIYDKWFADCEADCKKVAAISFVPSRSGWALCTWNQPRQAEADKPPAIISIPVQVASCILWAMFAVAIGFGFTCLTALCLLGSAFGAVVRGVRQLW